VDKSVGYDMKLLKLNEKLTMTQNWTNDVTPEGVCNSQKEIT
jgi:hypothetical protein